MLTTSKRCGPLIRMQPGQGLDPRALASPTPGLKPLLLNHLLAALTQLQTALVQGWKTITFEQIWLPPASVNKKFYGNRVMITYSCVIYRCVHGIRAELSN